MNKKANINANRPAFESLVASAKSAQGLLRAYTRHGVRAAIIGEVRKGEEGIEVVDEDRQRPLRVPAIDELARLLESTEKGLHTFQQPEALS